MRLTARHDLQIVARRRPQIQFALARFGSELDHRLPPAPRRPGHPFGRRFGPRPIAIHHARARARHRRPGHRLPSPPARPSAWTKPAPPRPRDSPPGTAARNPAHDSTARPLRALRGRAAGPAPRFRAGNARSPPRCRPPERPACSLHSAPGESRSMAAGWSAPRIRRRAPRQPRRAWRYSSTKAALARPAGAAP